jgi:hypothetical protein
MRRRAEAILSRHKEGGDSNEVVGQLTLWIKGIKSGSRSWITLADHHKPDIMALKHVLQQLHGKASKSVSVQHSDLVNQAHEASVQNGAETLAPEVEATSHFRDNLVVGAEASELSNLALKVRPLLLTQDPGVGNALAGWPHHGLDGASILGARDCGELREEVAAVVEPLALVADAARAQVAPISQLAQAGCRHTKVFGGLT